MSLHTTSSGVTRAVLPFCPICQHLSLLHFPKLQTYTIKNLWNHGRYKCLSCQLRSSFCLFSLLFPLSSQHTLLLSQKYWSKKAFFPISAMYMLAAFAKVLYLLGIFLAYFHFDNVCNCVCCFCCATALNSVCLTAAGFLFWIPLAFWIPSHAILLSFVISLILLDNFFCSENFSLLFQELILRILTTLLILTNPDHNLLFY